ncbi:MAG: NAD-dependent epimerase/dehydratase family protein, partial [Roseovarius sp.]
ILAANLPWSAFDGATVVIAGAAGFLPAYMVEVLLRRNETAGAQTRVVALVRNPDAARWRFRRQMDRGALSIERQDLGQALAYAGPADFIVHAASQASPKHYGGDPVGTALPNAIGTAHLLDLARAQACRGALFFSSAEVYGAATADPIHEAAFGPLDPTAIRSCYAESKRLGEALCVAHAHQHGVPAKIARPFHCYGPGMKLDDGRVFADFVAAAVQGRNIRLHGTGSARRAFCYISDATLAFFTILLRGQAGLAYNVGNPDAEISIRDLAKIVVGLSPTKGLSVETDGGVADGYIKSGAASATPDVSRLTELGWAPGIGLKAGFERTIRAYLS